MLTEYDTDQALATFRCGGIDPHLFLVSRWKGTEGVSQLYRFEVDLASADADIDLNAVLGSRATLTLRTDDGGVLPWHGIVTELRQTRRDETYAYYRAVLEPQLALLRLFRQSRAYVHADAQSGGKPDLASVIRMVLQQAGLTQEGDPKAQQAPHYAIRVPASDLNATKSSFICQFEETNLDFLMRRLEHAGVYFWFEQAYDREVVVFGNNRDQQPGRDISMVWRPEGELSPEAGVVAVSRFDHAVSVQPKGVVLRDFSVSQPSLDLTVKADVDPDALGASDRFDALGNIEVYGSHYKKQDYGERIATIRAEEIACQRNRYFGEVRSAGLRAGYPAVLHDHFRNSLNARYYVIQVEHEGRQSLPRQTAEQGDDGRFYHAHFTVLPAALQYRPARLTRVPRVVGFLSAIVMAEGDGQYAQMNEHGCYRIRFLFAPPGSGGQDDANSAWVRMATPYAGSQHGMNFPLLKGTEVLVSFLGGDPDRPIIVAAIPNEENPSIRNQDNATQPGLRTAGQNALGFEDKKGQEHARLSSPSCNSSFHLGTDPKKPEQSGIRLATAGRVGLTGTSSIQQVPGVYHQEIGATGEVDQDPEPRLAFKAAQDAQLAKYLEEQALLPNAKPALQVKALAKKLAAAEAALALLAHRLKEAKGADPLDQDLINMLLQQHEAATSDKGTLAKLRKLLDAVEKGDKTPEKALKESSEEISTKIPWMNDDEVTKVGDTPMTTTSSMGIVNTYALGINNTMSAALNNTISAAHNNNLALATSIDVLVGWANTVNVGLNMSVAVSRAKVLALDGKVEASTAFIRTAARDEAKIAARNQKIGQDELTALYRKLNIGAGYTCNMSGPYTVTGLTPNASITLSASSNLSSLIMDKGDVELKATNITLEGANAGVWVINDKAELGGNGQVTIQSFRGAVEITGKSMSADAEIMKLG